MKKHRSSPAASIVAVHDVRRIVPDAARGIHARQRHLRRNSAPEATTEMPFETPSEPPYSGETRAFPSMSFDQLAQTPPPPPPPAPAPEPSPWDEQNLGAETRAFNKMSFEDLQSMQQPLHPESRVRRSVRRAARAGAVQQRDARDSADQLRRAGQGRERRPEPTPEPVSEKSPWDEQPEEAPLFGGGGETHAFPQVSFADFQQPTPVTPEPAPEPEGSPWDEQPQFAGETRAFEKMSFDDLQALQQPAPAPEPEPSPSPRQSKPLRGKPRKSRRGRCRGGARRRRSTGNLRDRRRVAVSIPEDIPFAPETAEPELEAPPEAVEAEDRVGCGERGEAVAEPEEPVVPPPALAPEAPAVPIRTSDLPSSLTDEQIDKIACRVVELMFDQIVRNIAWEVILDLAEMVVKERIRQLESEA
jgi:hypothetical protein